MKNKTFKRQILIILINSNRMHNIKLIREDPKSFDKQIRRRGVSNIAKKILSIDNVKRNLINQLQLLQEKRNEASKLIGSLKSKGKDASEALSEVAQLKSKIPDIEVKIEESSKLLNEILVSLPNIPSPDVPDGKTEEDNIEIYNSGKPPSYKFVPKEHFELGEYLGMMNFDKAAKMSGSRFVIISDDLSRLARALSNFMLDFHVRENNYKELTTPHLVKEDALFGTGQLPKFEEDLFKTTGNKWLIPTAEVTLTNMVMNEIIKENELPLRYTAETSCFRSEAGAAGKDTKGMIRVHEFSKVELVSITSQEKSHAELDRLTKCAQSILDKLELSYRIMLLSSEDMGFASHKTFDIEVWLPGQGKYREVSSCSNCTDFQARRMNARYRDKSGNIKYLHTLNGSGLAVGRTLIAILETYQKEDGSIEIPKVLKKYMGGQDLITKVSP